MRMIRLTVISIVILNFCLIVAIGGRRRPHLPAEEHDDSDDQRGRDHQRRSQGL
jgi:hypothetical protein